MKQDGKNTEFEPGDPEWDDFQSKLPPNCTLHSFGTSPINWKWWHWIDAILGDYVRRWRGKRNLKRFENQVREAMGQD